MNDLIAFIVADIVIVALFVMWLKMKILNKGEDPRREESPSVRTSGEHRPGWGYQPSQMDSEIDLTPPQGGSGYPSIPPGQSGSLPMIMSDQIQVSGTCKSCGTTTKFIDSMGCDLDSLVLRFTCVKCRSRWDEIYKFSQRITR